MSSSWSAALDELLVMDLGSDQALEALIEPAASIAQADLYNEDAESAPIPRAPTPSALVVVPPLVEQRLLGSPHAPPQVHAELAPTLEAVLQSMENVDVHLQVRKDVQAIANFHFANPRQLHGSKEVISRITQVDPSDVEAQVTLLASTLSELDKIGRFRLEEAVVRSGFRLLAYFEFIRYDETPMKVSLQQPLVQTQDFAGAESGSTAGSQAAEDLRLAAETFVRTTATSKLLASHWRQ